MEREEEEVGMGVGGREGEGISGEEVGREEEEMGSRGRGGWEGRGRDGE